MKYSEPGVTRHPPDFALYQEKNKVLLVYLVPGIGKGVKENTEKWREKKWEINIG